MDKAVDPRSIRFAHWLAATSFGKAMFPQHANQLVFAFVLFTHSIYWATSWWSPWPFLIFNLVGFWFSQGILKPWETVITQAIQPNYDSTVLKISIPFILVNYVAIFACLYMFGEVVDSSLNPIEGMWKHFYFSAVTLTTLGYGNLIPGDLFTEVIATVESLIGFLGFAVLAGVVATIVIKRVELD